MFKNIPCSLTYVEKKSKIKSNRPLLKMKRYKKQILLSILQQKFESSYLKNKRKQTN